MQMSGFVVVICSSSSSSSSSIVPAVKDALNFIHSRSNADR